MLSFKRISLLVILASTAFGNPVLAGGGSTEDKVDNSRTSHVRSIVPFGTKDPSLEQPATDQPNTSETPLRAIEEERKNNGKEKPAQSYSTYSRYKPQYNKIPLAINFEPTLRDFTLKK